MLKLNLGCYQTSLEGYENVDIMNIPGVDRVCDLNVLPWPWKDGSVEEVLALDVFEHLGKLTKVEIMEELARITKPGAKVIIRVPCATDTIALQSIQHAHVFYFDTFESSHAQPYFHCERRFVALTSAYRELPFEFPYRWLWRLLGRFGFIRVLIFHLCRLDGEYQWQSA